MKISSNFVAFLENTNFTEQKIYFAVSFDQIACLDHWCKLKNQQAKLVVLLMQGSVFGVFNFSGRNFVDGNGILQEFQ